LIESQGINTLPRRKEMRKVLLALAALALAASAGTIKITNNTGG